LFIFKTSDYLLIIEVQNDDDDRALPLLVLHLDTIRHYLSIVWAQVIQQHLDTGRLNDSGQELKEAIDTSGWSSLQDSLMKTLGELVVYYNVTPRLFAELH
jgi:hypothetical protein